MDQPGVEVRPIKMISGECEFNEVFFTDARCPKENVVGGVNNGWAVAMTLLGYERGEAAATFPIRFRAELDRLVALAQERGVADDPLIRQRLAWCYSKVEIMRFLGMRTLTKFLAGHHPGPDASIFKLYWSEYHQVVTELAVDILGADALVADGRGRRRRRSRPTTPARRTTAAVVGRHVPQRPGRHDLRRHRRRSSATSSARWCSASRRSRGRRESGLREGLPSRPVGAASPVACGRQRCVRRCGSRPGVVAAAPFLPLPAPDYLRFRMLTQYGDAAHRPSPRMC